MVTTRPWIRLAAALLVVGLSLGVASAQPAGTAKPLPALVVPPALDKAAPENVADLRAIEQHVHKVLTRIMPAVVGVRIGPAQGSGVIVQEDGTILTAGHVSGKPDRSASVILPNGKIFKARTLGKNGGIDSGMMKIADDGKYPFVELGRSADLKAGQWVLAIGHPGGFRANRTPVVRLGRILFANAFVIRTDCTLVGGDSGGPLFDMHGRLIGIHSRIGGAITENVHVPIDTYRQTWDRLAKGESWGGQLGQVALVKSAGGKVVFEKKDKLAAADPTDKVQQNSHCKIYTFPMKAGSTYTIDLVGNDRSGRKLDPFLRLENSSGKELAQDDDGAGFPNSRIVYKAVQDGDYRIIATSFEPHQTGAFTLKILEADFTDALVHGKVEVLKALKMPSFAVKPFVEKFKQVKVPLHVNAILLNEKGQPMPGQSITLQWEKGTATLKSNADGVIRWALRPDQSQKLSLDLPAGTGALLALTDADGHSIIMNFPAKVKDAGGQLVKTMDGHLTAKDTIDPLRPKCHQQVHEVTLQAGKTYTIDLVSDDFDAFLRLENAAKNKLAEDDDGAGNLNSRIVCTPATTGTYRIVATTCDPGCVGAYRVTVRESDAPPVPASGKKTDQK